MKTLLLSTIALSLGLTACMPATTSMSSSSASAPMSAKLTTFTGTVSAANEVPAIISAVNGTVMLVLNEDLKTASVSGMVMGLSGAPAAQHIHVAFKGANGPVLKPLSSTVSGTNMYTISGGFNLTDAEIIDLKAKKFYFNIHTAANPGGEGRAQLE